MNRNAELLAMREQALAAEALKRRGGGLEKWLGHLVKIGFDTDDEQVTKGWMWVRVDSVKSGRLAGSLGNHPAFANMKFGDTVSLTQDDIVAIYMKENDV